ncbi:hypothetical protein ACS126_01010 [Sphingobacterium lactis]|uniref:hypothetical protein n=1 Tax=Sphingobacterium lactis TaxID=797291 RepID=UPI003EC77132
MQKQKITQLLFTLCLVLGFTMVLSSCSKDEDGPSDSGNYFMKAKFNGELKEFKQQPSFQGGGNDGRLEHIVLGADEIYFKDVKPGEMSPGFVIEIWNIGGDIKNGTYTYNGGGGIDRDDANSYSLKSYYMLDGYTRYGANETENLTMVITELQRDKSIRGTFKGVFTLNDESGKTITITDGEFYLPYRDN